MCDVGITGTAQLPVETDTDRTIREMAIDVARAAIDDAGLTGDSIDGVFVAKANGDAHFSKQLAYGFLPEELGLSNCRLNAAIHAGGATGLNMLTFSEGKLVASPDYDHMLCVHVEKASLAEEPGDPGSGLNQQWETHTGVNWTTVAPLQAERYMHETGATAEQVAAVAVACREWARRHPNALRRESITVSDVLDSPMVSTPYHALETNIRADGATAFVVSDRTAVEPGRRIATLEGYGSRVTHASVATPPSVFVGGRARWQTVTTEALAAAELTHDDVDLVNIYAASPAGHLEILEGMGFQEKGGAGPFVAAGETQPGGELPMTTNGGSLAHGHLGSGVGVAMLVETADQVTRSVTPDRQVPDARYGLQTGGGGVGMSAKVAILGGAEA